MNHTAETLLKDALKKAETRAAEVKEANRRIISDGERAQREVNDANREVEDLKRALSDINAADTARRGPTETTPKQ